GQQFGRYPLPGQRVIGCADELLAVGCSARWPGCVLGDGAGQDELGQGEEGQRWHGGDQPSGRAVPGLGDLGGQGQDSGGDQDGHGVGDRPVCAFAAADLQPGRGGGQFGDDGVGPAEPAAGSGRDVVHGPVVDVGEGGGPGHAADHQQNQDLG